MFSRSILTFSWTLSSRSSAARSFSALADVNVTFIERDGTITQFVNFNERAWHAGRSSYLGRPECNNYSIGIELEGSDFMPFTQEQYDTLAPVIAAIYDAYPKTRRHVTGHSDIAPGRKTDPGDFFEWPKLREMVAHSLIDSKL